MAKAKEMTRLEYRVERDRIKTLLQAASNRLVALAENVRQNPELIAEKRGVKTKNPYATMRDIGFEINSVAEALAKFF